MIIKINEDVEGYKETVAMGLTGRQIIFSGAALLVGAGIALCLFRKIGIMASCYIATPIIIPIALMGFYELNGMNFFQFFTRFLRSFKMKPLCYHSTESVRAYQKMVEVPKKEQKEKQLKKERQDKCRERMKKSKSRKKRGWK